MTEQEIKQICKQYKIEHYKINPDMSIDVDGPVNLSYIKFAIPNKLPLKFDSVTGFFYCEFSELTTLGGCPSHVGGDFNCSENSPTSLEGCPKYIGGDFNCTYNELTTLEYCPKYVGGGFYCSYNKLSTLRHFPVNFHIGGHLSCHSNNISNAAEYGKLFFGYIGGSILTDSYVINVFLNEHKNPPKKDLPKLLSELRKITL